MKKIFIIILSLFAIISCSEELDTKPTGDSLTPEMVSEGAQLSPARAEAGLGGMYALLNEYRGVYRWQSDFGYPGLMTKLEHSGDNVVSTTHGYNWFNRDMQLMRRKKPDTAPVLFWNYGYKYVKAANDIILALDPKDESLKGSIGQAYAMRAFAYHMLVQMFQQTYKGNESALGVPIVTDQTEATKLSDNPRAPLSEVYALILEDLGKAIEYLPDGEAKAKNFISKAVAYGLRSRVHLTMNNWAEAAADAQKAIESTSATPFTIEDASIPNFDDVATGSNSMWGIIITQEDAVTKTGIANWTSMFTSFPFGNGGYTTLVGTWKRINRLLHSKISDTDVRKGWWAYQRVVVGKDKKTGKDVFGWTSPQVHKAYPDHERYIASKFAPHTVTKFAPNEKDVLSKVNAVDFQLMRVEEMYYNLAEAKAMGGDLAGAKSVLENFVKTYRDPQYSINVASAKDFQDEIYFQKRIEFWGEGISWFDMMRMKKGIERVDIDNKKTGGYPVLTRFNVPAADPILILQLPLSEEQANKAIEGNNNPEGTEPKDMI